MSKSNIVKCGQLVKIIHGACGTESEVMHPEDVDGYIDACIDSCNQNGTFIDADNYKIVGINCDIHEEVGESFNEATSVDHPTRRAEEDNM